MADDSHQSTDEADRRGPSPRQILHAATGDRDAEAEALAEEDEAIDVDDAKVAVQRAHGESVEEPIADHDVARPEDAEDVGED